MKRCGPESPYGCGHHIEHVRAARKGWITRRAGVEFRSSEEHGAVRALLGMEVKHAHEHKSHAGFTLFKSGPDWFEVPTAVFKRYAAKGKLLQGEEAKLARAQKRHDEQGEKVYLRELARLQAEDERAAVRARHNEEQERVKAERQRARDLRRHEASGAAQYREVVRHIRASGGIRPNRADSRGKIPELEEWRDLPASVKTRKGGQALDDIAAEVGREFGDLGIQTGDDLAAYLKSQHRRQVNAALINKHRSVA